MTQGKPHSYNQECRQPDRNKATHQRTWLMHKPDTPFFPLDSFIECMCRTGYVASCLASSGPQPYGLVYSHLPPTIVSNQDLRSFFQFNSMQPLRSFHYQRHQAFKKPRQTNHPVEKPHISHFRFQSYKKKRKKISGHAGYNQNVKHQEVYRLKHLVNITTLESFFFFFARSICFYD